MAGLKAGVARASINPLEAGIDTQLGGYGERRGKPAEGTHDTIYAKALVFDFGGRKGALVALDVCHLPWALVEKTVAKAALPGLDTNNVLMSASHDHAGLEGMSMDARNIANNPSIGIFKPEILEFVSDRVAQALKEADAALRPVRAGAAVTPLPGMNRNRRDSGKATDEDLTVLRLDTEDGRPYAVLTNYTAHGTIMTAEIMQVSGGWAGVMQRSAEALIGEGVTCLYTNGPEGDVSPAGYAGAGRWEMAERYGRKVGIAVARLSGAIVTQAVETFGMAVHWLELPERQASPDFAKIAGDEYQVSEEELGMLLGVLFPPRAPFYALRIDDYALISFPGEPISEIGLDVKQTLRKSGIRYPAVASLTNDFIGYILSAEEYRKSGYEVTTSFYGEGLGAHVLAAVKPFSKEAAELAW